MPDGVVPASGRATGGDSIPDAVGGLRRAARRFGAYSEGRPWYRQRAALAVLAVVLVLAPAMIAYHISSNRPDVYVAHGEVLFSVEDAFVDESTSETLALIGRSDRVLAPVAEATGMSLGDLQDSVTTSVVGTTTVVTVDVRREDRAEAKAVAQTITEQWVDVARRPTTPINGGMVAAITAQTTELGEVEAQLTADDLSDEDRVALEAVRDRLVVQIDELENELAALRGDDLFLGHTATILVPAGAQRAPVEPKPLQAAIAGGVIGLVLAGAVLAVAWQLNARE